MSEELRKSEELLKRCSKCAEVKTRDEFWRNRAAADGLQTWCIECLRGYPARDRARQKYESKYDRVRMPGEGRPRIPKAEAAPDQAEVVEQT